MGIGTADPQGYKLRVNGPLYASSITDGSVSSDIRLKKNIETLPDDTLNKVLQLRGVRFDFRGDEFKERNLPEGKQIGLIAQELEKQFPELVMTGFDGYKSVAYDKLSAVLVEALKQEAKKTGKQELEMAQLKEIVKKQQEEIRELKKK